ncbi:hypothetical protein GCM10023195_55930 [Actinoallomurus liliacearum]|uniref:Antitoxin VbhA domain-containing protein n=1 Tax=Actinoallomurus liliacearum TaxID=1080073 RepID=A0ABP8TT28_9ACTN
MNDADGPAARPIRAAHRVDEDRRDVIALAAGELVRAQREKLRRLYYKGRISAEVLRAVDRWLDLDDPDVHGEVG